MSNDSCNLQFNRSTVNNTKFSMDNEEKISFCLWNINVLTTEKLSCIHSLIEKFDLIAVIETWLKEHHCHSLLLNGYTLQCFYHTSISHRVNRGSGGIAVYIKDQIVRGVEKVQDKNLKAIEDRVWFRLHRSFFSLENDLYLGVWYIPPLHSCRHIQMVEMWAVLEEEIPKER